MPVALFPLILWSSLFGPAQQPPDPSARRAPGSSLKGASEAPGADAPHALVRALDIERFKEHIRYLSSLDPPINGTRYKGTAGNAAARDYIQAELESYGYDVERHQFHHGTDQVYATKIGKDPSVMYIVSAHMDSANGDSPSSIFAPGADDDASGTALVLEVARVFALANLETDVSIRFVLWNWEEVGRTGSRRYVSERAPLQGIEEPLGSGQYPEPVWLGMIQHDMILWDHGSEPNPPEPPWPPQDPNADIDIEYQADSDEAFTSLDLATHFLAANAEFATDYPAEIGDQMCCTDSNEFMDHCAAISLRENRRANEIGPGSNPHWHADSDVYETFGPEDFLLGFNAVQTTTGAVATLVNAQFR